MNSITGTQNSFWKVLPNHAYAYHMKSIRKRPALCSRCRCQADARSGGSRLAGRSAKNIPAQSQAKNSPHANVTPIDRVTAKSVNDSIPSPANDVRKE